MGFELAEQFGWRLPDWIVYPTGGGTGLIGMWKAFDEMEAIGWLAPGQRPRMVSVQPSGCAPIVRAFHEGTEKARLWENPYTIADGLRVPRAPGDFLMLRVLRASGGTGVSVDDAELVSDMRAMGTLEGISAAPEGAASLSALRRLIAAGRIQPDETVVLFNTGGALKYLDVLAR
jgi:threonine synthase